MSGDFSTAEAALFGDRALPGMIGVRREEGPDGTRYLVFIKRKPRSAVSAYERRFRIEGDTLTEVDVG